MPTGHLRLTMNHHAVDVVNVTCVVDDDHADNAECHQANANAPFANEVDANSVKSLISKKNSYASFLKNHTYFYLWIMNHRSLIIDHYCFASNLSTLSFNSLIHSSKTATI